MTLPKSAVDNGFNPLWLQYSLKCKKKELKTTQTLDLGRDLGPLGSNYYFSIGLAQNGMTIMMTTM